MRKIITILFLLFSISIAKANFYEIDVSKRVINFSSFCKQGKISVFIMSQHGCSPCITAKNYFKHKYANNPYVDIYYCMRTKNRDDLNHFQNRPSTLMWGYVEAYTSSPRIYIFSPTGNPQTIFSGFDKSKVELVMDGLLESMSYYRKDLVFFKKKASNSDYKQYVNKINNLKIDLNNCIENKKELKYQNKECKNNLKEINNNFNKIISKNILLKKVADSLAIQNDTLYKINLILNNRINSLSDSIAKINKKTNYSKQTIAEIWYNLAKENEKQIQEKKRRKERMIYFIKQANKYYIKSINMGVNCNDEYKIFKVKYGKYLHLTKAIRNAG